MNSDLQALLDHQRHVVTSSQATAAGISPHELSQHLASGSLVRLSRGAYVDAIVFRGAVGEDQHLYRCRGVLANLPSGMSLSHHSAALAWGMPWVGAVPDHVHVVRNVEGPYRRGSTHTINRPFPGTRVSERDGLRVVEPASALLGLAAHHGFRPTVVALDAGLHSHLVDEPRLREILKRDSRRPGARILDRALAVADAGAESPGESLTRLLLNDLGFAVRSQVEITATNPLFRARVDFLLRSHQVIIEFDGLSKYAGTDGTGNRHALVREKAREDRLRSLGFDVVRLVWADLSKPDRVRSMIEAACARGARSPGAPVRQEGIALR